MRRASIAVAAALSAAIVPAAAEPDGARQGELMTLLRRDCGACHGLRLDGGLGPALTREALAGRSAADLQAVILDGRAAAAMPPWRGILSEEEAAWLADVLLGDARAGAGAD
jgi:cytochrome c55X